MKNNNLPPFYVGQKVVCVKTTARTVKGNIYTVSDNNRCGKCNTWYSDVGVRDPESIFLYISVCSCGDETTMDKPIVWIGSKNFAPIESQFQSITFKEVVEIESPLISVQ